MEDKTEGSFWLTHEPELRKLIAAGGTLSSLARHYNIPRSQVAGALNALGLETLASKTYRSIRKQMEH